MNLNAPKIITAAPFCSACSTASVANAALDQCLAQLGPIPAEARLGLIYATDAHAAALPELVAALQQRTGISAWVGTVGIGLSAGDSEYYETPALALMALELPQDSFRVFSGIDTHIDGFALQHKDWYGPHTHHFAIAHGDPRNAAIPQLIAALADTLPGGYLVGGITSSNTSYPQAATTLTEGGLSGVVFGPGVAVATALTQGCSPIGPKRIVTECERNIVVAIDNRPALDVFREDIGEVLARDLDRVAGYIFVGLPISGSDRADYLVRNLLGIDVGNKLLAVGEMLTPGLPIQFCRRDAASAEEDMTRMLRDLKRRLPHTPRGAVYYSCLGRGRNLFGADSIELGFIRRELGDFPLVGFFANGEISHNRLYGYTGVLTVFL